MHDGTTDTALMSSLIYRGERRARNAWLRLLVVGPLLAVVLVFGAGLLVEYLASFGAPASANWVRGRLAYQFRLYLHLGALFVFPAAIVGWTCIKVFRNYAHLRRQGIWDALLLSGRDSSGLVSALITVLGDRPIYLHACLMTALLVFQVRQGSIAEAATGGAYIFSVLSCCLGVRLGARLLARAIDQERWITIPQKLVSILAIQAALVCMLILLNPARDPYETAIPNWLRTSDTPESLFRLELRWPPPQFSPQVGSATSRLRGTRTYRPLPPSDTPPKWESTRRHYLAGPFMVRLAGVALLTLLAMVTVNWLSMAGSISLKTLLPSGWLDVWWSLLFGGSAIYFWAMLHNTHIHTVQVPIALLHHALLLWWLRQWHEKRAPQD